MIDNSNVEKLFHLQTTTAGAEPNHSIFHHALSSVTRRDNVGSSSTATSTTTTTTDNKPLLVDETINLPDYERIQVVGQGSFGVAILYKNKRNHNVVVLKQIHLSELTMSEKELAMNEVAVFSKLHHPNIIW